MLSHLLLAAGALLLAACEQAEAPAAAGLAQAYAVATRTAPAPYPALSGQVVDAANVLTGRQESSLARRLAALERVTADQVAIATVPSLQGRRIEDYSRDLANHWGLGQADRDDGVLLLLAPTERQTRIEVGRGLEHILTDADARNIVRRDLLPHFRRSDWFGGLEAGGRAIAELLESRASRERGRRP